MANTVNIGKTARATAGRGQRRFGGRFYRAIGLAAIALVVLGLAAGATISRMRPAAVPAAAPDTPVNPYWEYVEDVSIDAPQSVLSNPFAYDPHVYTEWDFREDRRAVVPADASVTTDYRWGFGGDYALVGPVPAFDWEQQERTQVAPGPVPPVLVSIPGPWLGTCRAGSVDCLPDGDYPVSALPATPPVYAGPCRAGSSDCLPDGDYLPGQDY